MRARRHLLRKYGRLVLQGDPAFLIKETLDVLFRRSLMPIVNRHLTPL